MVKINITSVGTDILCLHWERYITSVIFLLKIHDLNWIMEKAMAPHSSTLAWKIPWTEEPGRLQPMGLQRVGHDWATSFTFHFRALEEEMATHSSVLAWRIPGMAEPGGLPSLGSHRVEHNWSDLAAEETLDKFKLRDILWNSLNS